MAPKPHKFRRRARDCSIHLSLVAIALIAIQSQAAEVIPPKPPGYFQDNAGVVSQSAALRFNEQLAQFERETSNQVWVVVYPKMQSDSDVSDYTRRVAQIWGVGQKDRRNGAVLFVFTQDRKMFIQVGYGLEGALPDLTAFDITEYRIKPHFRSNDYEGGLSEGIDSILKAIRGEYKGTGKTARERHGGEGSSFAGNLILFLFFGIFLFFISRLKPRHGYHYSSSGSGWAWALGSGGGGGGWSSGGGGGGGFSESLGGGGSFGGGGAGSSW